MYPTISHLLFDLFGINIPLPIQTFGFWVAIAFIFASWIISNELKRKEKEGFLSSTKVNEIIGESLTTSEIISSLLTGFFIGFKFIEALFHYTDLVNNPQDFILSTRGNLLGGILIAAISFYLKWTENNKTKLATPKTIEKIVHPFELVGNMTMIAAVSGIIGAKIFHNLENMDAFLADPIGQLISFSGLTFYGGLIAGAVSVIWYANKYKINTKHLIDSAAPGLMLAYGVGRIGCQMSGDGDWGIDNLAPKPEWMSFLPDWMWSYTFPHNVINAGVPIEGCTGNFCMELANPVWPTAFYEVIMSLAIFGILWAMRKHIKVPGALFFIYLAFNGVERFFIEKIRINTEYNILGGITQAEIISFSLILTAIIGVTYLYKSKKAV
ncbi:MAG: diacylglyceryl transferase [Flavobacteriales bacterium]|jgi:prolipoprotein diacylglyceryltransferase|nr:diacylglyceryl transferase [Flavobacteriales bacterium]MBT5274286.1 diacylglyceryl transferase [Flavobacteriales bacterium]